MELPLDEVRTRIADRRLFLPDGSLEAAVAALNTGNHIALIATTAPDEVVTAAAELLADCAATFGLCIGWFNLPLGAGALVHVDELVNSRFMLDLWLVLARPSPTAISRILDDVQRLWKDSNARLVVSTSTEILSRAPLSPAGRRALVPIAV